MQNVETTVEKKLATADLTNVEPNNVKEVKHILNHLNLDWDVRLEDLVAISTFPDNEGDMLGTYNAGIFRNDDHTHLGTVSKKYTIYQNAELVDTILMAAEDCGMEITSGGQCYGGARVYLNLSLPTISVGKSKVKRAITVINGHDGKGSVRFAASYSILMNGKVNNYCKIFGTTNSFRHTSSVSQRVNKAVAGMFESLQKEQATIEKMVAMSNYKFSPDPGSKDHAFFKELILKCFKVDLNQSIAKSSTRTINNMNNVSNSVQSFMTGENKTLWGLFNGILNSTAMKTPKGQQTKDYTMVGRGNVVNQRAFDIISNFLDRG
jgi:hypothetical protein